MDVQIPPESSQSLERPQLNACLRARYNVHLAMYEISIEIYEDRNGNRPFLDWFHSLRDVKTQARIESRLRRLALGNMGDYRTLRGGLTNCVWVLGRDIESIAVE